MNKWTRKEKQKSDELEKAQISIVVEDEGSSTEVSEKGNITKTYLTTLKKKEWDDNWKVYLEAQWWISDQIWEFQLSLKKN